MQKSAKRELSFFLKTSLILSFEFSIFLKSKDQKTHYPYHFTAKRDKVIEAHKFKKNCG